MDEIANVDQAARWDGAEGDEWTEGEERRNAMLRAHTPRLFEGAAVAAGDRVLDVGCGCGETTREAATLASPGAVLGVDLSARMLERARQRADEAHLDNVRFEQADVQVHRFKPATVDLVISRYGVMFFADPVAAFTNIAAATAPAGRLALLVWQELDRNEWLVALRRALAVGRDLPVPPPHAPGPLGLADADFVRTTLATAGFVDVELEDVEAPFWLGADADDAFTSALGLGVVKGLLDDLDADYRAEALDALRTSFADHATASGVQFDSRSWLVTARRA